MLIQTVIEHVFALVEMGDGKVVFIVSNCGSVGQSLEHSRIYCIGTNGDMEMCTSSADLMTRNLMHRVEVVCPTYDRDIKSWINTYLDKIFQDNTKARSVWQRIKAVFLGD